MKKIIKLEKDKEYYYIFTTCKSNYLKHNFVFINDISIFEKEEWFNITEISKTLEKHVLKLIEIENPTNPRYSLNNCIYKNDYCNLHLIHRSNFKIGTCDQIYEDIFKKQEEKENDQEVYINEFRKWIYENYGRLQRKYQDAKEFLEN